MFLPDVLICWNLDLRDRGVLATHSPKLTARFAQRMRLCAYTPDRHTIWFPISFIRHPVSLITYLTFDPYL